MKLIDRDELVRILNKRREFYCDNTPDSFSKLSYPDKCRVDMLDTCISDAFNIPSKSFDSVIEEIKAKCDDINEVAKGLNYVQCRTIQDSLADIMSVLYKHISGKESQ